jgi:hypothetical protein
MSFGYVYVISNPSMPGILKIGFTTRPIEERLQEANAGSTWIPTPFSLDLYKFVVHPQDKEGTLHKILSKDRVNPKREFFRVELEQVKLLFDLMDTSVDHEPDIESRLVGDEVLRLFLDTFVYPSTVDSEALPWSKIASFFQSWKREQGYVAGNAIKLREILIEAYGKPNRGEGWTAFRLQI